MSQNQTIYRCYLLKDRLRNSLNHLTGKAGKVHMALWIRDVMRSKMGPLVHFAHMLLNWFVALFTTSNRATNGLAEGLNIVFDTVIKKGYDFYDMEHPKPKIMQQQRNYEELYDYPYSH